MTGVSGPAAFDELYDSAPDSPVLAELTDSVLLLTLHRPEVLNAWNGAMEDRYMRLLEAADDDPRVRAIVVTGAGRGFCTGADMNGLKHVGERTEADLIKPVPRDLPLHLRKPLIGAVNGVAAGLGMVQALYFDVRFGSRDARFTTAFARRGLIAEYGSSVLLTRMIGRSRAADLLLSGRMVGADEAHRIGLLDHVVDGPVAEAAVDYAADIAAHCSPRSLAVIKRQLLHDDDFDYPSAAARSETLMLESFHTADAAEGIGSHLERRPAEFPALPPARRRPQPRRRGPRRRPGRRLAVDPAGREQLSGPPGAIRTAPLTPVPHNPRPAQRDPAEENRCRSSPCPSAPRTCAPS